MNNKTVLRSNAKEIRKNLDIESVSEKIVKKIKDNDLYKQANNVMLFYPTKYEINLLDLLNDNKNFYFPRVNEEDLLICPYEKGIRLEKSKFNILEPCSSPVSAHVLDLIIVPALMVDKQGFRLGYGGGFYDKFLSGFENKVSTLVVIPNELYVESLPREDFDVPIDVVILA